MQLEDYLAQNGTKKSDFATLVEISPSHLSGLLKGRRPSLELAFKIEYATNGLVRAEDWTGGGGGQE